MNFLWLVVNLNNDFWKCQLLFLSPQVTLMDTKYPKFPDHFKPENAKKVLKFNDNMHSYYYTNTGTSRFMYIGIVPEAAPFEDTESEQAVVIDDDAGDIVEDFDDDPAQPAAATRKKRTLEDEIIYHTQLEREENRAEGQQEAETTEEKTVIEPPPGFELGLALLQCYELNGMELEIASCYVIIKHFDNDFLSAFILPCNVFLLRYLIDLYRSTQSHALVRSPRTLYRKCMM